MTSERARESAVERAAKALYACEKARADNANEVLSGASGRTISSMVIEPWEECRETFMGDARAALDAASVPTADARAIWDAEPHVVSCPTRRSRVGVCNCYEKRALRALEAALSNREAVDSWQPIETAPEGGGAIWVGHLGPYGLWGMEPVRARSACEWQNIYTDKMIDWAPTHWQPLPPPLGFRNLGKER